MSYRICFDDLTTIHGTTNQSFSKCGEALSLLAENVTTFVGLPSLKGAAAERMKAYLHEVHGTLLASISELITEYQVRFLLYRDEMFQLDSDLHAELDEATFDSLLSFFPGSQNGFDSEAGDLKRVVDTISDLISEYGPSDSSINNDYGDIIHSITTLKEEVGTCEYMHASNDLNSFKALLSSFEGLIASYMGQNKSVTINYQSGSIADVPAAQQLNTAYINSKAGRDGLENRIKEAIGRDEQRFAQLEKEAAEARVDQGIWQAIGAIAAVVVGAVAIVATAGMATPIVVTALVAGSASMAYGYSNLFEAGQNIGFGLAGDATSAAINPLRDTIFMGNQTAYDVFGFTATFVAGSMIPIGKAVDIAVKAGKPVSQAVIMGTGQSAATVAAGYGGGKLGSSIGYTISKDWFGADERTARHISNASGVVGGMTAGMAAYKLSGMVVNKTLQSNTMKRPSWRQSELDAEKRYSGYDTQKSFLNGKEVAYGTKGSSRPELFKTGHSVEVKNYNVQTNAGRSSLVRNICKQIRERVVNLPSGTKQTILVDVRGQSVNNSLLKSIRSEIWQKSGVKVEVIFRR